MVKVKLPDIRKNKLSVIIKSLEKRDAAMQRFQRRDLYNAKSVKVVENTQIELYLPTLLGDKGKPAWSGSTQPDNGRKGAETRAKNGTKDYKDDGHKKGGSDDSKSSRKKANGSDASELGNGNGGGKVNVMMGRKIPNMRPLLTNGLKTLRVDESIGPFSSREVKEREKASNGTGASKVEMVFKPGHALVSAKESQRFSTTKTNMLSLKSWNQNNPTENAYHWLSSGPGELDQVQLFKTSIGKNLLGRGARNGKAVTQPDPGMTSTEKFTVSMVKPSLPQVSTSPPHSHHILEQILQQQLGEGGDGSERERERERDGGLLWRQKSLSPSHSESASPTRVGREEADGDGSFEGNVNQFSAHQRSYHHGEFSSYRDNSHIQGNISQHHARTGKGGQSFIEASFLVKNVSKSGTPQVVSGQTGPQLSPSRSQGLGIKGTSPKKLNRPPGTTSRTNGSIQSSPSLPPVDQSASKANASATSGGASIQATGDASSLGVFMMPNRYEQNVQNVDEETSGSITSIGSSSSNNLEGSQAEIMDSVIWLSTKSALAQASKKNQMVKRRQAGGNAASISASGESPPMRKPTPGPQQIISSNRQISPSRGRDHLGNRTTTRHGMIPERTSKAVLCPLHLSAKAPFFRERSIKGLSIAAKKPGGGT